MIDITLSRFSFQYETREVPKIMRVLIAVCSRGFIRRDDFLLAKMK